MTPQGEGAELCPAATIPNQPGSQRGQVGTEPEDPPEGTGTLRPRARLLGWQPPSLSPGSFCNIFVASQPAPWPGWSCSIIPSLL